MASPCFPLGREERLEKFSFAVLFKGKWGNYEAEQKAKKEKKKAKAAEKQLKEESKDKVVKVDVKEEPVRPSEALSLWSPADGWGGAGGQRTVLGRQGDLLLLSWTQGRRVAGYFTDKKEVEGQAEKMADRAVEAGDVCPALEPKAVVGVVVATFHREEGATLEQVGPLCAPPHAGVCGGGAPLPLLPAAGGEVCAAGAGRGQVGQVG